MKFLTTLIATLLLAFQVVGQPVSISVVKGVINHEKATKVTLYAVHEGDYQEIATQQLRNTKEFAFAIPNAQEGFYYIGCNARRNCTRIYLKANDQLVIILDEVMKPSLVKGSVENKLAIEWGNQSYEYVRCGSLDSRANTTYKEFFPMIEKTARQADNFKMKLTTPNKRFNAAMKMAVQLDLEGTALLFPMLPNTIHPELKDYPAFYSKILVAPKFSDGQVLQLAEAKRFITTYPSMYYRHHMTADDMKDFYQKSKGKVMGIDLMDNDTLKGIMVVNSLRSHRTFDDLEAAVEPYRKYLVTDSMMSAYQAALRSVASFKKGSTAYNFSYEDLGGKKVSMTDLKGKVVLVDMWATWCGPCKAEIPHLKKLEEEMHQTNVAFVSISVDEAKDKQKWKDFVTKENLGGIQLFASGWSEMTRYYQVNGIPRFMVFDAEGKIVTADAPRPSSPELKQLLEKTLQGGNP